MEKEIRTGIIGLGKMGILHSALINMIPQANLVAVHDVNRKLSKYVEKTGLGVTFYADLDRMLEEAALTAAFICTPPFTHLPIARKCVSRNIDLFVEKPLAESYPSAREMVSLLEEKNIIHSTGFINAHVPIFREAKRILDQKILGGLFRFNASIYISQVFSKKKSWFFDKSKSGGGVIIDIASHVIFLITWYFGSPHAVYAQLPSFFSDVEDSGFVFMDFDDGLTGVLDTSWSVPGYRTSSLEVVIEGENGIMEITNDFIKMHLAEAAPAFDKGWTTLHKIDLGSRSHFELGTEGFSDEDAHFLACCAERKRPHVTWVEGLEVQRIIEAIYRSDAAKEPFSLRSIR